MNAKRLKEEGEFSTRARIWGLGYDADACTRRLSEHKLLKGAHLLNQGCFDPRERRVPMIEVQRLRGNAMYWQVVQPALQPELGAIDAVLRQARVGAPQRR